MKWILIGGAAGLAYLYWKGSNLSTLPVGATVGTGITGVPQNIMNGWTATLADLHIGPCVGCAGKTAAPAAQPMAPIYIGGM